MKKLRQQKILEIVAGKRIATQRDLARELARHRVAATQSSISRDIMKLGLAKVDGYYATPSEELSLDGPIIDLEPAGENLIVARTEVGMAQPAALKIDRARIDEVIGTVAGDDTILIAVKNAAAQRIAVKKIIKLFERRTRRAPGPPAT